MELKPLGINAGQRRRWILALSGGGYRGLFTARFLEHLEIELKLPLSEVFDLVAGTSIGSIIALGLAHGIEAKRLVSIFTEDGQRIFPQRRLGWARQLVMPKHSKEALQNVLESAFGTATLGNARTHVVVPAVRLSDTRAELFRSRNGAKGASEVGFVHAALASAAAPTYFSPHKIDGQLYVDGGLIANSPDAVAVNEAMGPLGWLREDLNLLSVGTTREATGLPTLEGSWNWGGLRWGWGLRLLKQMMGAQAHLSRQSAEQLLGERLHVVDPTRSDEQDDALGLDLANPVSRDTLIAMADAAWAMFKESVAGERAISSMMRHGRAKG